MMSTVSELLFIIEYTNAPLGDLAILLMKSCSSILMLSALHTANYIGKSFVNHHSRDCGVIKANECGLGNHCGRQSRAKEG